MTRDTLSNINKYVHNYVSVNCLNSTSSALADTFILSRCKLKYYLFTRKSLFP